MNTVVPVERQQPKETAATSIVQVIERAARDSNVDIDKMERLLAMHERVLAREAEAEFNRAMTDCQAEMRPVEVDANNPQTSSKYASFAALDRALRPTYTKHGFALSFDEADTPKTDHVRMVCHVSHRSGFTRTYHRDMPVDTTGIKGNVNMTRTHANASAQSYAMRYLERLIFNVAVGEGDNDGNGALPRITEKQAADLLALLTETGANVVQFKKWAKVRDLTEILAKNYDFVIQEVRSRGEARR